MTTPSAPLQAAFDRYLYDTAVLVNPADLHGGIWNFITDYDWVIADMVNHLNGVFGSGMQVTATSTGPSPMKFSVSTGRGRAMGGLTSVSLFQTGVIGQPTSFDINLVNGAGIPGGQSRIDVVCAQYSWTLYTDSDGFNHQVDTTAVVVVQGTAGVSPVPPALPDSTYVGLANVTVHSGDTTSSQASIDNTARNTFSNLQAAQTAVPTGTILATGGGSADPGFLLCDGSTYASTTYQALFNRIGYTFGGSGGNFKVPKFNNGSFPLGVDGVTYLLGGTGGAASHTLAISEIPSHVHADSGHTHGTTDAGHNHTQNSHTHTVTDAGHNHTQNAHNHGITDPGHTHVVSDPGHSHPITTDNGGGNGLTAHASAGSDPGGSSSNSVVTNVTINSATTGISAANTTPTNQSNTTGVSNNATTPTNQSATTGLTVNSGSAVIGATGGGMSFSLLPPWVGVNYQIKT